MSRGVPRRITGFHRDEEGHWVADLECGHAQHVRHDPPWQVRPWVLDESSRQGHLGTPLRCVGCLTDPVLSPEAQRTYDDALLRGLCQEGALELALRGGSSPA